MGSNSRKWVNSILRSLDFTSFRLRIESRFNFRLLDEVRNFLVRFAFQVN